MPPPQPPSRVPEARPAGLIAIVLSSIFTYATAGWVIKTTEFFLRDHGFDAGVVTLTIIAVIIEWVLVAQLIQFVMDEYIIIPLYHRSSALHNETFMRRIDGKETWWERHGFKIAFLVLLIFYLTKK